jgi:tetratricopeptide (TPR) repeat protein
VAGAVAGFACAVASPLVYFDGEILPTPLETFLLAASVLCVGVLLRDRAAVQRRLAWLGAGTVLGLAAICRPTFLAFVPLAGWIAWRTLRGVASARAAAILVALYLVGVVVPVGVVTLRNLRAGQGFVLVTANLGPNLLLGNNAEADGMNPFLPAFVTRMRRDAVASGATQVEVSRAAAVAAREYMGSNPGRTAALWFKKAVLFYNRHEIPNDRSIRDQAARSRVLGNPPVAWVGVGMLLPLALAGFVAWGRNRALRTLVWSVLAVAPLVYMPFIVCARFRAPFVPLLAVGAGAAVAHLASRAPRRDLVRMALLAAAGVALAWPNWYDVRRASEFAPLARNQARLYMDVAQEAARRGDTSTATRLAGEARAFLDRAVQEQPASAVAASSLGGFLALQGDRSGARQAYERALELDPANAEAHMGLAFVATQENQYEDAEAHVRRAMQLDPGDPDHEAKLADIVFARGRFEEAIRLYEHTRVERPRIDAFGRSTAGGSTTQARYAQAQIHLARARLAEAGGDAAAAEKELRDAAATLSENPTYKVELALFMRRQGRVAEAMQLLRACAQDPTLPAFRRTQLEALIRRVEQP